MALEDLLNPKSDQAAVASLYGQFAAFAGIAALKLVGKEIFGDQEDEFYVAVIDEWMKKVKAAQEEEIAQIFGDSSASFLLGIQGVNADEFKLKAEQTLARAEALAKESLGI